MAIECVWCPHQASSPQWLALAVLGSLAMGAWPLLLGCALPPWRWLLMAGLLGWTPLGLDLLKLASCKQAAGKGKEA